MANFFSNLYRKVFKKKEESKPLVFEIGAGLPPEEAERVKRNLAAKSEGYISGSGNPFRDLVNDSLRALPRAGASVFTQKELEPTNFFARTLFGEETVKPIAQRVAENELTLKDMGVKKGALPLAFTGTIAGTTLDLLPIPGKKEVGEQALKALTKEEERVITKQLFKNLDNLHDAVNKGTGTVEEWAQASAIASRIEKGTETVEDFHKAKEILETHTVRETGFIKSEVPDLVRNPQAGFVKVPTEKEASEWMLNKRTEFIDQYSPLYDLTKGKNLSPDVDPYVAARNFAGHYGKVQNRLDELSEVLLPVRDDLDAFKRYAKLERFEELAKRGIREFEGELTLDGIIKEKAKLIDELGIDRVARIESQLQALRQYTDNLLTYYKDSGMISEDAYRAIKINNEKYIPLHRVEYLDNQFDNIPAGSNTFNVTEQNLVQTIKGSKKEVADPLESIVRNTYRAINTAERNKVAQKMAMLSTDPEFKNIIFPTKGSLPVGYGKFSVFENGIKHEYAAPKVLVDVMKNLNSAETDFITKLASKSSAMLRAGATIFNAAFIPTNAIRDFQNAILVSKVGFNPADWIRGFAEAWRKGDTYKAFLENGASYSGFFERNKNLTTTVKKLTQRKTVAAAKYLNPFEIIREIGEKIELAPRLGVYKKAVNQGKSGTEAAFIARNATIDFAKTGSTMKVLNQWVPFLNARTQGAMNLFSAVKNRPARSAVIMTGLVGIPVVATYIHNSKNYPEIWNDIADFEKENNVLIIYGDERDEEGNPTQVMKIPKADVLKIFGNPLESFLTFMDDGESQSITDIATQMFSDLSPVSFAQNGDFNLRTTISGLTPPTIKAGWETTTNQNSFTGFPIVPESMEDASPENQYKNDTSPLYIKLGEFLKVSPLLLENAVNTQFGGVAKQVANPGKFGSTITSRFSGAKGNQGVRDNFEELDKVEQQYVDKRVDAKRTAERVYQELINLPPNERQAYSQGLAQQGILTTEVLEQLDTLLTKKARGLDAFEESLRSKPTEVRARMLAEKLRELPIEERRRLFVEWSEKKIITPEVLKDLSKVLRE